MDPAALLSAMVLLLVGWALKLLYGISNDMKELSGRVGKVETWSESHDKQDDERHDLVLAELRELYQGGR